MQRYTRETLATALEGESTWLHTLARALTRDVEAASDAAQTTLLRAWERAPGGGPPRRAWMARVLTNSLREDRRRAGLRRAKEELAASEDRAEDGETAMERLELQRRVIDAVDALSEPYRTTLVLRFFDGLTVRAIAVRQQVPSKTVYTRIERGLARLRAQLDSRFGNDRSAWVGALLGLPPSGWSWVSVLKGAGAMEAGTKVVIGTGMVVATVGAMILMRADDAPRVNETVAPMDRVVVASQPEPVEAVTGDGARLPVPEASVPTSKRVASTAEGGTEPVAAMIALTGSVLDTSGAPLPGVIVRAQRFSEDPETTTSTDVDGRFVLDWDRERLPVSIVVDDPLYASLRKAYVTRTTMRREHMIVAARAADLRGIVVNEYGRPLASASVSAVYDDSLMVEFPHALDSTVRVHPRVVTDADGRFELRRVPVPAACELHVHKRGHQAADVALTEPYTDELLIELRSLTTEEAEPEAEGVVLLPSGEPAVGATVRYGFNETTADEDGRFRLPLDPRPAADLQLAAGRQGYGTALVERYGELQVLAAPYAPAPVTLVLRDGASSIAGRVLNQDGEGVAGWLVKLQDGTSLTRNQTPPVLAEAILGGSGTVETAADGSFELGDLLERDYDLLAYDPQTLVALRLGPIAAGTRDVLFEIPEGVTYPRVGGRVVSRHGTPVERASVSVGLVLHRLEHGQSWISGGIVETDADGRFELLNVARSNVHLNVGGETIVPVQYDFDPVGDVEDLVIEVALRCHFRVDVTGEDLSDLGIQVVDAVGKSIQINTFTPTGSASSSYKHLVDGKMEVAAVSEDGLTVILLQGSWPNRRELTRRELVLVPGEVCVVRIELE